MLQISCRYRLLGFCALTWTDHLRWNLFATGNRGGNVAVRRRWARQLSDVGQFGLVSGTAAYPPACERAWVVQATLRAAASEVILRNEKEEAPSSRFPSERLSFRNLILTKIKTFSRYTPNGRSPNLPSSTTKKPRRRVATVSQRRAANIRERRRMFNLNEAFDKLRRKVRLSSRNNIFWGINREEINEIWT